MSEITSGLTFHSDLAIAVTVTGSEESLGLLVTERSGRGREVLQEQPGRRKRESFQVEILLFFTLSLSPVSVEHLTSARPPQ